MSANNGLEAMEQSINLYRATKPRTAKGSGIKCFKLGVHILQIEKEDKDGYFPSYYWHPDTKTTCDLGMGIDLNRHLQNVHDRIEKEEND